MPWAITLAAGPSGASLSNNGCPCRTIASSADSTGVFPVIISAQISAKA